MDLEVEVDMDANVDGGDEDNVHNKVSEKEAGTQIQSGEQAEKRPKAVDRGPVLGEL